MGANYEVNIQLNTEELKKQLDVIDKRVSNLGGGKGGSKNPPRILRGGQFKSDIDALYKAQEKNLAITKKIDILEIKGVKTNKMREELGKLNAAQGNRLGEL